MKAPTESDLETARRAAADSPWLRRFPVDLRECFLERTRLLPPFQRGDRVYNIGDPPDGIYGVVSGCFGFEIAPQEEGPQLVHQYRAGSWFGELAHVLERPRLATIYATRPSQCLRISGTELASLLRSDPRLWQQIAISLADASRLAMTAVNDLLARSPKRRLAACLLRVAGLRNDEPSDDGRIEIDLTHSALAAMTNCSRTTVAHYLKELEADGFIEYHYGRIHLGRIRSLRHWLQTLSS